MYFPRYWAFGNIDGRNRRGEQVNVGAWGWSDTSIEDARARGEARATALLPNIPPDVRPRKRDHYYEGRPFREEVLLDVSQGSVPALITRNSVGCEVLNTDNAAFADIDYDPPRRSFFASLFAGGKRKETEARAAWESQALEKVRAWQATHPAWSFRVYRTAGGLRLLLVSALKAAVSAESIDWLEAIGSDPLYLQLCKNQKSFRARLTPKPWRCGWSQSGIRFPYSDMSEKMLAEWIEGYKKQCENFSVCEFVETVGQPTPLPELKPIIELHDTRTGARSGLPLA